MSFSKHKTEKIWQEISKKSEKEQWHILEWKLQAREPIYEFSDIKPGDHLVKKFQKFGEIWYYHHFLCIDSNEGNPIIIHYTNTGKNATKQLFKTGSFSSGSTLGQVGIVQEMTLPHKDFLSKKELLQEKGREIERVVWPEELKRLSVEEVMDIF